MEKKISRLANDLMSIAALVTVSIGFSGIIGTVGCSTSPSKSEASAENVSPTGPSILNVHTEPDLITLNEFLEPTQVSGVIADVKDFSAPLADVRLKFNNIPVEIPMKNIGGTTWRADLNKERLQVLAVSGQTINYAANVVARDQAGNSAMSSTPVNVAIKTPDLMNRYPAESNQ